jgi:ATP-binding cassette subfamily B multidrug efflux pump
VKRPDFDPDGSGKARALELGLLRRLWEFVRPQRRRILESLLLLLFNQACRLAQPTLIALALDRYLLDNPPEGNWSRVIGAWERFESWAGPRVGLDGYELLLAAFALAVLLEYGARRRQVWLLDLAGQTALLDLRVALFRHLQRLSSSFYDRTPVGRLVGRTTTDVEALAELFSSGVVTILGDFVNLAAMTAVLLWISWPLALLCFAVAPILVLLTLWVRRKVRACYDVLVSRRSAMASFLHEHVVGMDLVQSFVRERVAAERFGEFNADMRDAQVVAVKWESILSALVELIGALTTALILWYGGALVLDGLEPAGAASVALTLGTLFMFIDYMAKFFEPLTDLSLKYTVMQNAMTAASKIFRLLDVSEMLPEPARPVSPVTRAGRVEFRDVSFSYSGDTDEDVLRELSFEIAPGEHVAVVGATGSGKTTLMKLLTRLYDVREGAVLVDGVDVRAFATPDLRGRVGVVPQEVLLFEGSVVDNLRLGHPEIPDGRAIEAGRSLGLEQIVGRFERGWYETVQERGKNLSAGERQLLAFARAMAAAPEVVVLDEATSNVDTATEELLTEALERLLEGRTALIIAHRLSTIRGADRILVLERGRLVEQGTHAELLARRGAYWRLHRLQFTSESA